MEPRDRDAQGLTTLRGSRVRILAGSILLTGLAFVISPGFQIADTKFDLAVDPAGFLARATHLWDPTADFGLLQNQSYGYLWPMGPFFALGKFAGLSPWIVQRCWIALVLVVAFVGMAKLARVLGVRSDIAVLVAGFAFAASPRMLTTLGPISIEAWPSALAPWVLVPLVLGCRAGYSPRRMGLYAGLAVATVGGVNAAATFAVIPLGALWLLTRRPGHRQLALIGWWALFTVLGTVWWLVPLFLLGSYSPPFLDFIESAQATTLPTTLFNALRGTSDWVPYVEPAWRGGRQLISDGLLALYSGGVLMLGTAGLLLRRTPEMLFLVLGLAGGLVLVTAGHLGAVQGWFAGDVQSLLDGSLAALRNVHKFDPVLRIPMVLGLAWFVDAASRATMPRGLIARIGAPVTVFPAIALVCVGAAALPLVQGRLAPADPVIETPGYWTDATRWLNAHPGGGATLLAPASSFGTYLWGAPHDEPARYLGMRDWAVRDAIPLTPPGTIRMLDAVESRLATGQASPGLADYLRRAGIGRLLVRNDLAPGNDTADPALVHAALDGSPGITRVAAFGPDIGGAPITSWAGTRVAIDDGWARQRPAIEVYAVDGPMSTASSVTDLPVVIGGPEDLLGLADLGVLDDQATELAADVRSGTAVKGPVILTDGMLDRERNFGRVDDAVSAVITPGDGRRTGNAARDYLLPQPPQGNRWRTTAELIGAKSVSASSALSYAGALGASRPGYLPYAAIDGSTNTQWASDPLATGRPWWRVTFDDARTVGSVTIMPGAAVSSARTVVVSTEAGHVEASLRPGQPTTVALPSGTTRWVQVGAASDGPLALAEVAIPGATVRRALVLPSVPADWPDPDKVVLRSLSDARTGCVGTLVVACAGGRAVPPEESDLVTRIVRLARPESFTAVLRARARATPAALDQLQEGRLVRVEASTQVVPDLRSSGLAAIDGDPGTTWTASAYDRLPHLTLSWLRPQRVRGVDIMLGSTAAARMPTRLELSWPGGHREVTLRQGRASWPAIRTRSLTIGIASAASGISVDASGDRSVLPIGISELRLRGVDVTTPLDTRVRTLPCGSGPTMSVDGRMHQTALKASAAQLFAGTAALPLRICKGDAVTLGRRTSVSFGASTRAEIDDAVLTRAGADIPSLSGESVPVTRSGAAAFTFHAPGPGTVVVRQNVNRGWQARQNGKALTPVVVDGWQQGWLTGGAGEVRASFAPDASYRLALVIGGALLALMVLLLWPARRWRSDTGSCRELRLRWWAAVPVVALAGGLLGGGAGVAAMAAGVLVGLAARRIPEDGGVVLLAVVPLVASGWYLVLPWGSADGWAGLHAAPDYLVLAALGAVFAGAVAFLPGRHRRIIGRSTKR